MNTTEGPLLIGITGGIGSGKSVVCRIFHVLGIPVYNSDNRARYLMTSDTALQVAIRAEFGMLAFDAQGDLNRAYLATTVFTSEEKRKALNKLVHPRVAEDFKAWLAVQQEAPYIIKEAALIFESGSYRELDKVGVVTAPESMRIGRVLARDPYRTETDVRNIIRSQWPDAQKTERADFVITNDEQVMVVPQVLALHGRFVEASARNRQPS